MATVVARNANMTAVVRPMMGAYGGALAESAFGASMESGGRFYVDVCLVVPVYTFNLLFNKLDKFFQFQSQLQM
jgi:hypothetical protein